MEVRPAPATTSGSAWPAVIIVSAAVAGLCILGGVAKPVQAIVAFWFLLVCPGMALVGFLDIRDRATQLIVGLACSLALEMALAEIMVYRHLWSMRGAVSILIVLSVAAAVLQLVKQFSGRNEDEGILLRVLKGVALLGAGTVVAIVVSAIVAFSRPAGNHHATPKSVSTSTSVTATRPPTGITAPVPPVLPAVDPVTSACSHTGSHCRAALLMLINGDRHAHHLPPLLLDMTQTRGSAATGGHRRCVGTRGHTRAMAKSGRTWHRNTRYPHASYPHDICRPGTRSAENDDAASGNEWAAVQTIEQHSMHSTTQRGRLLSRHFTHIGLDLERRGFRVFVTEDFLGP